MIPEGTELSQFSQAELLKKIESTVQAHPLLAQSGIVNAQALGDSEWFKKLAKWLPYIAVGFLALRFLSQQQYVFLLRRIERQLNKLEKR